MTNQGYFPSYSALLDETKVMTGQSGMLFWGDKPLVQVNTFDIRQSFKNIAYTAAGSGQEKNIPSGHAYTVTLKETVIADLDLWAQWIGLGMLNPSDPQIGAIATSANETAGLPDRPFMMSIALRGELSDNDGNSTSIYLDRLVPDGDVSILNVAPEQLFEREWSMKVNGTPQLQTIWQKYAQ